MYKSLIAFLLLVFAANSVFAGEHCCTVETRTIEEMPNDSKKSYSVVIPQADYKISTKRLNKKLRSISGSKLESDGAFMKTQPFFWGGTINDTVTIYMMVLPEGNGSVIHAALESSAGWVDPETGSMSSFFSEEIKQLGEYVYSYIINEQMKDARSDRKGEESDLKKVNKKIKKLRKNIVKSENKISKLQNEITMLEGEQQKLIGDISKERNTMLSTKGEDKDAYKKAKKSKKKLNKQLKKAKKEEEKNRKKILDYRNDIRNDEEEISKHQGTREHHKTRIKDLQQKRRDLKQKIKD